MILGERYKSRKGFWMLILNSNDQTLQRAMFSKSTCNVSFKLFDVALVFYVIVFGLFANFFLNDFNAFGTQLFAHSKI